MPMDWNVLAQGLMNFSNLMQGLLAQQIQLEREQKAFEKRLGLQTEKQKEVAKFEAGLRKEIEREQAELEHQRRMELLRQEYNLRSEEQEKQFFNWDSNFYEKYKNYANLPKEERKKVDLFLTLHEKVAGSEPLTKDELEFLKQDKEFQLFGGKITVLNANALNQKLDVDLKKLNIATTEEQLKQNKELFPLRKKEVEAQIKYLQELGERMQSETNVANLRIYAENMERLLAINTQRATALIRGINQAYAQLPKVKKDQRKALEEQIKNYGTELQQVQNLILQIFNEQQNLMNRLSQMYSLPLDLSSITLPNPLLNKPAPVQPNTPSLFQTPQARSVFQSLPKEEQDTLLQFLEALKELNK